MTINELIKELQRAKRAHGGDIKIKTNSSWVDLDGNELRGQHSDGTEFVGVKMRIAKHGHIVEYDYDLEPAFLIW